MKYLIAGLGNIGDEYQNTRHNIGFNLVDKIATKTNAGFTLSRHAFMCQTRHRGRQLILIKPTTYMNLSGKAIKYWMDKEKVALENTLIVTDDIALPFGTIRMRAKGSDGGHNGLKNIQQIIASSKYPRLRFGVGQDFKKGQQVKHVLGHWTYEEASMLESLIERGAESILSFCSIGIQQTMNIYNTKT